MQVVLLAKGSWRLDPAAPLGKPGGFGAVFSGLAPDGSAVAVKRFKVTGDNAEHREMQMADFLIGQDLLGVMPVLDSGLDKRSDRYFLVMPLAEGSLQDFVDLHGAIPESDAIDILLAIATGLASLDSLVHRDLKPHNVLKHDSIWKVADFGLARFVEDATSAQTVKNCMTVPYAAPEQLRMDRCTKATDVYALGCIAHTLLTGKPPFKGPRHADYFRQHTQEQPEEVPASPPLRGLTTSMLLKSPGARPSIGRVLAQLERARRDRAGPVDPLAEAAAKIANAGAVVEAASERASAVLKTRNDLARTGLEQLDSLIKNLYDEVCTAAPLAHRERNVVSLGDGHIQLFLEYGIVDEEAFARAIWSDVVAGALLSVGQPGPRCHGRSANLWYADLDGSGSYRWWETSYWSWRGAYDLDAPAALRGPEGLRLAAQVVSGVTSGVQFVHAPRAIDFEDHDSFVRRWKNWLAECSLNKMQRPSRLPEEPC